jgi:hypothetical protein
MANFYGSTFTGVLDVTPATAKADASKSRSKLRTTTEVFDLAALYAANGNVAIPAGSFLICGKLPVGARYSSMVVTTDTSLGSTTISSGTAASNAKYGAAATAALTDTPLTKTKASAKAQAPLTTEEIVGLTTAVGALPTTGIMVVETHWTEAA